MHLFVLDPALLSTNGTQVSNQPNQVQTQQIQNPALIAPVMPQNPVQPVQTATPMQTAAQMPAQTTTQATTTVNEQTQPQTASVAPVTPEGAYLILAFGRYLPNPYFKTIFAPSQVDLRLILP